MKLRPGPGFSRLELPGRELSEELLTSVYEDTDDLRLAAGSTTLRRRVTDGNGTGVWQLKLKHGSDRLELEWEAPDARLPG